MKNEANIRTLLPNSWAFLLWSISLATLLIFQSSNEVSVNKVLFALYFFSAALIAVLHTANPSNHLLRERRSTWILPLASSAYNFALLLVHGFSQSQLRDSFPYLFVALAPVLGSAIGRNLDPRYIFVSALLLSVMASLLSFVDWVDRRGATDALSKIGLSSGALPAFGLAVAAWAAFYTRGRKRTTLLIVAATILALMLGTGTRTNLVFLVVLLPFLFSDRKFLGEFYLERFRKKISSILGLLVFLSISILAVLSLFGLTSLFQRRFFELTEAFLQNPTNDQSFVLRAVYYQEAQKIFMENPIIGMGFSPFGNVSVLDTPFEGLAKIGVVGNLLLVFVLLGAYTKLNKTADAHNLYALRGVQGWFFVLMALVPFGTIWQDKGLPIAIILAYALAESLASNKDVVRNVSSRKRHRVMSLPLAKSG
jgi:hypothetical protein